MKQSIRREIGRFSLLLLLIYGAVVVYFVLFSDRLGRTDGYSTYRYNLVLLDEIRRFIRYRDSVSTGAFVLNLIGNLLVFFPLGFLIPIWREKKTGVIRILIYAFLFSLGIETLQLVSRVGVFDVDDLLLNTAGGLLGFAGYRLLMWLYHLGAFSFIGDMKSSSVRDADRYSPGQKDEEDSPGRESEKLPYSASGGERKK